MPIFQVDSDQLHEIARIFEGEADCARQLLQDIDNRTDGLRGYGWIGLGAESYYDEFDNRIRPALNALIRFLEAQSTEASKIAKQIEQAADDIVATAKSSIR